MRLGWVLLGGIIGGGLVVGLFAWDRSRLWQERAREARAALEGRGSAVEFALRSQGEKLRLELAAEGQRLAESAARAEAERVIGLEYGLTPTRVRQMQQLWARWG